MEIYAESIEEILEKNLGLGENEPIVSVGVTVVTKPFNSDKPFFYKSNIRHLYKSDLNSFVSEEDKKTNRIFERYTTAVRGYVNMAIDDFRDSLECTSLATVLENDWYTKKLVNEEIIQEAQGFVFDPQEISKGR
jgi:hypothetical protein